MIDRDKPILLLRFGILRNAAAISACACAACPVTALLIVLVASIVFLAIQTLYVVVLVVAWVALIGGIVLTVAGLVALGENPGILFLGVLAAALGYGLSTLAPGLNVGDEVFHSIIPPAYSIMEWFIASRWFILAWIPSAAVIAAAAATFIGVHLARYTPEWLRRFRRRHTDCPACHCRMRPQHICANCGAAETDLRPSIFGVLFARCEECHKRLPTLDLIGRKALARVCGNCKTAIANCDIGHLRVSHVVVVRADRVEAPRTTLHTTEGQLEYVHACSVLDLANTKSASFHPYLKYLDRLVLLGDEGSFRKRLAEMAGFVGVMERALTLNVRRRARVPVTVIEDPRAIKSASKTIHASDVWVQFLNRTFRRVTLVRPSNDGV